ncbi:hypothetical protein QQ045_005179 [Rhodiola kirilowii]
MEFVAVAREVLSWRVMMWIWVFVLLGVLSSGRVVLGSDYTIGLGSYDITGPAADVNMMGYANFEQVASGVHFRLRARSFIVAEPHGNRVAFVNLDACMESQLVMIKVIEKLKARYGDLYTEKNVAISVIHTHAGPGGYLQYITYSVTSFGFVRQSFDALVDGIEKSIIQAHENLRPGSIYVNKGELLDASVNRSPSAYLNNPAAERSKYKYDVDKEMTLLKFVDNEWGSPVGSFNWFATHGTSMSRTNSLISGDNKGAAERFMEDWFEQNSHQVRYRGGLDGNEIPRRISNIIPNLPENHHQLLEIAATFNSSRGNQLQSSPVFQGVSGVLSGRLISCVLFQPFVNRIVEIYPDVFESTRIIGDRQFRKAVDLFEKATEKLTGKVDSRHAYLDFSNLKVTIRKRGNVSEVVKTCPAAMGFSFGAGTTDGPGAFNFKQGDDKGNLFWKLIRNLIKTPGKEQIDCQYPKPILLDTGEMKLPYDWAPSILPIQIIQVGQLAILSVPGEFTTMAGRRLRDAVRAVLLSEGKKQFNGNVHVVIAGLTNTYSQYVTTFEEYEVQRYEEFTKLATALVKGQPTQPGPQPPDLLNKQISLLPPVVLDATPLGVNFGDVSSDVPANSTFKRGQNVTVTFWSACPRNDLMTEGTFALVEFLLGGDAWSPAYDDDDFCLRFIWSRPSMLSPQSKATIEWRIPQSAAPGVYRIKHFGQMAAPGSMDKEQVGEEMSWSLIRIRVQIFCMAEKEMEYRVELFNKLTQTCFNKCVDKK